MHKQVLNRHGLAFSAVSLLFSTVAAWGQQPVVVTNNANQPVPVAGVIYLQNQVLSTPEPVQIQFTLDFGITATAPKVAFSIPFLKRLVIEHFAARCTSLNAATQEFFLRLGADQNTQLAWLDANAISYTQGGAFTGAIGANAKPVHAYLDAASVWVDGERSVIGGATSCTVTILGYYTP